MARKSAIEKALEKAYAAARAEEVEELQSAIAEIVAEHRCSIENILFALDIIRFQLMTARYKEIMGVVKLTDKPPLKKK